MITIKKASEITGLTPKSIRHYESIGLLQTAARTQSGYRQYSEDDIDRLHQIRYYRDLKFTLEEIASLINAPQQVVEAALIRQLRVLSERLNEYHYAQSIIFSALHNRNKSHAQKLKGHHNLAIIAIDLQNDMLEGGALACKRILTILTPLQTLFAQARSAGVPIIYICDCHRKGDPELLIWDDHMIEGTYGAQIIDAVAPGEKDFIIKKNLFNGFVNTNLQNTLDLLGIDTLLFSGWRTDVCVAQTAIEAFYRGYRVAIARDGVNTTTQSEHDFGMALMGVNYDFEVYDCADAIKAFVGDEPVDSAIPGDE